MMNNQLFLGKLTPGKHGIRPKKSPTKMVPAIKSPKVTACAKKSPAKKFPATKFPDIKIIK